MPTSKKSDRALASFINTYEQLITPVDLGDLFNLLERDGDGSKANRLFDHMVDAAHKENSGRACMSSGEYLDACDRVSAALPPELSSLNVRVRDYESAKIAAQADVALRIGIEIGRRLRREPTELSR